MTFDEARKIVLDCVPEPTHTQVSIGQARNRVLAKDIIANSDSPRFDNSAVDGFALGSTKPGAFEIMGQIQAGLSKDHAITSENHCFQIFTGAKTPAGTQCVVMQEDTQRLKEQIVVSETLKLGANIRARGQEYQEHDVVLKSGQMITPPVLAGIAAMGLDQVAVRERPSVAVLSTGNELIEPGCPLKDGEIYDSNSHGILAMLQDLGLPSQKFRAVDVEKDVVSQITNALENYQILLTSGGVSVGEFDFVRAALDQMGFEIQVHRVAIKPGRPFLFGTRNDGKYVFGLPGNPMSALTTFSLFAYPFLCQWLGLEEHKPISATLKTTIENGGDRTEFLPARTEFIQKDSGWSCHPTIGSHATLGLVNSNGFLRLEPESCAMSGDEVVVYPAPWWCCG